MKAQKNMFPGITVLFLIITSLMGNMNTIISI